MSDLREQFSDNSNQVKEAERRLAIQTAYLERLRTSAGHTKAAEEALEVIRDILRGLYIQRAQLRRRLGSQKHAVKKNPPHRSAPCRSSSSRRW
jgi:chromosome segregation ATPase